MLHREKSNVGKREGKISEPVVKARGGEQGDEPRENKTRKSSKSKKRTERGNQPRGGKKKDRTNPLQKEKDS